jgi:hypothetical protein
MTNPSSPLALLLARNEAARQNFDFALKKLADAMEDFSFSSSVAVQTDSAVRAKEIADAALSRTR